MRVVEAAKHIECRFVGLVDDAPAEASRINLANVEALQFIVREVARAERKKFLRDIVLVARTAENRLL